MGLGGSSGLDGTDVDSSRTGSVGRPVVQLDGQGLCLAESAASLGTSQGQRGSGRRRPRDGEGVRATPGRELGKAFAFADLDRWVRKRLRSFLRKRQGRPGCARGWDNVQWPPAFFVRLELFSF